MTDRKKRSRAATEARVLDAAAGILIGEGAAALGINALAKAAGCDKQLIYRYFDGIEGVMKALGEDVARRLSSSLAGTLAEPARTWETFATALARGLLDAYRRDPLLGRIRAAEFASPAGAMSAFSAARGPVLQEWVAAMRPATAPPAGVDVAAVIALLAGAVEAAVLSAAATGAMAGMPLRDEAGWARLEAALTGIVAAVFREAGENDGAS